MTDEEPLLVSFEVAVPVEHAFDVWVARTGLWWPRGHTVSGDPESVAFEPFVGGRIVERDAHGREHVWGEVTAWEAPSLLGFRWHLFFDAESATDVTMRFEPSEAGTRIRLEQRGFERLGETGRSRREGNTHGWAATTTAYRAFIST